MALASNEDYVCAYHMFKWVKKLEPEALEKTRFIMSDIVRSYKVLTDFQTHKVVC